MLGPERLRRFAAGLLVVAATAALAAQGINWNLGGGADASIPLTDRTKSLLNAMTPAQRYHSTLFREYVHPGNPITETLRSVWMIFEPGVGGDTLDTFLQKRICGDSRTALEGTVLSGETHPIDDGSFLFTDYTVRVTKVFREPPHRRLRTNDTIVVGAPGGQMVIAGVLVSATTNTDAQLTRDSGYLMFANYSRTFGVFDMSSPIFAIDHDSLRPAAPEVLEFLSDFNLGGTLVRRDVEDRIAQAARCSR